MKEALVWLEQAKKDLEVAKLLRELKHHWLSVFESQQAVEKSLKALYILRYNQLPPKTHNLVFLGKKIKAPQEILEVCKKLTRENIYTRYPLGLLVPYKYYTDLDSKEAIGEAEKVIKWVAKQLSL